MIIRHNVALSCVKSYIKQEQQNWRLYNFIFNITIINEEINILILFPFSVQWNDRQQFANEL